jgi:hypothetical protein
MICSSEHDTVDLLPLSNFMRPFFRFELVLRPTLHSNAEIQFDHLAPSTWSSYDPEHICVHLFDIFLL